MSKLSPSSNKGHDLGASDKKWGTLHVGTVSAEDASISGNVVISGNLTVEGATTELNMTNLTIQDPLFKVADGNAANTVDLGFYGQYNEGGGARYSGLAKDVSDGKWKLFDNVAVEPTTTFDGSASGQLKAASFEGALIGNADSATVLDNARNFSISGDITAAAIAFDGSAGVELIATIDAGAVTNEMLAGSIADGKLAQDYVQTSEVDNSTVEWSGTALRVKAGGITNTQIAMSTIQNNKLANSGFTLGGQSVSLGQTVALPVIDLSMSTNYPAASLTGSIADGQLAQDYIQVTEVDDSSIEWSGTELQVKALGITNAMLAGSIENAKLVNSSVSFGGVSLALGQSDASPAFNLTDSTGYPSAQLVGTVADNQLAQDYIQTSEVDNSSIEFAAGSLNIKALGVTNAMLAGSIANDKLVNSSVSFGGVSLALGASDASPAFDLADAYNYPTAQLVGSVADGQLAQDYIQTSEVDNSSIQFSAGALSVKALGITNGMLAGSIENAKLVNSSIGVAGVSMTLGSAYAQPAFDLTNAINYPASSLSGTIADGQLAQNYIQTSEVDNSSIEFTADALKVKALGVTNAMLAGSIENAKLSNSSVSFGGVTLSLGQSDASPAFNLADSTGYPSAQLVGSVADNQLAQDYIQTAEVDNSTIEWSGSAIRVKDLGITNAKLAGSIANAKLVNSSITIAAGTNATGGSLASDAVSLGETLTINGVTGETDVTIGANAITIGLPQNVSVTNNLSAGGNLTVTGDATISGQASIAGQFFANNASVRFADTLLELGVGNSSNIDHGWFSRRAADSYAGVFFDETDDKFKLFTLASADKPESTVNTADAGYAAGSLVVNALTANGALSASGLNYPTSDGTVGQVLATNGDSDLFWQDAAIAPSLSVSTLTSLTLSTGVEKRQLYHSRATTTTLAVLPSAATAGAGYELVVRNSNQGGSSLAITRAGSDTIWVDYATQSAVSKEVTADTTITFVSDGVNKWIVM